MLSYILDLNVQLQLRVIWSDRHFVLQVFINFAMLQDSDGDRDSPPAATRRPPSGGGAQSSPSYSRLNSGSHVPDEKLG